MGLFTWAKRAAKPAEAPAPDGAATETARRIRAAEAAKAGAALLDAQDFSGACKAFHEALALDAESASHCVNLAYALQQCGLEAEALPHLQQAVMLDPGSFDARYMLSSALEKLPDLFGAAEQLQAAIVLRPEFDQAHADLCRVLALSGDTETARVAITAATSRSPGNADLHRALGNLCMTENEPRAALESYARALVLRPGDPTTLANQGWALVALKRYDEAQAALEAALAIAPDLVEAHIKLGLTFKAQERFVEASASLERALKLRPEHAEAINHLGIVQQQQGLLDVAIVSYRRAIALAPDLPGGYANLGLALYEQGDVAQAIVVYRQGLAIRPVAEIHDNLAIALQKRGHVDEAIEHYYKALALQPDNLNTQCNLAAALADGGGPREAIAAYRQILELHPGHMVAHSNLLFNLSVDEHCSSAEYLAEARRFDRKLVGPASKPSGVLASADGRRLRIGLVSGDLRIHPVGYFLEGILRHLDARKFELCAYPTIAKQDELTARIKPLFSVWRLLKGLSDEAAAEAICADRIDILLDLAGHTGDNRLPVFGMRPAPVQVSWLGYFASTGVSAIDYVLADEVCVPPGNEHLFTEKVWRMPETRLCFTPPVDPSAPDVSALPALQRGHITFGCFQRLPKINDAVLGLWQQVFEALPNARLLLQSHQTGRPVYVEQILGRLAAFGISRDRVVVRGPAPRQAYLESYCEVDIVLDTFPYTGGTTTCEALWMGVPTLTLTGESMIARQGVALLSAAELADWVADSPAQYVRKAVAFGSDLAALSRLRSSLRERIQTTSLFDVRLFAQRLEGAFAGIWQAHMSHGGQSGVSPTSALTQNVTSNEDEAR